MLRVPFDTGSTNSHAHISLLPSGTALTPLEEKKLVNTLAGLLAPKGAMTLEGLRLPEFDRAISVDRHEFQVFTSLKLQATLQVLLPSIPICFMTSLSSTIRRTSINDDNFVWTMIQCGKCRTLYSYNYEVGQRMLKNLHRSNELQSKWNGPHTISCIHVNGTVTFDHGHGITERINIRHIKPYREPTPIGIT